MDVAAYEKALSERRFAAASIVGMVLGMLEVGAIPPHLRDQAQRLLDEYSEANARMEAARVAEPVAAAA